jgi:Domain of unknown function (DUF1851)
MFAQRFSPSTTTDAPGEPWLPSQLAGAKGYQEFARRYAGMTFDGGLYRVHDTSSGQLSQRLMDDMFPEFAAQACPFAYDWLGRQFALDNARVDGGEAMVLLLEPGTGEALEIPLSFMAFHEQLDELREPALANSLFTEWSESHAEALPLAFGACVGYRVPLFLGGKDILSNLEVIDLDVYWTLSGQLRKGTLRMKPGTSITEVSAIN